MTIAESQDRLLGFGPEGHLTLLLPCPFLACFLAGITRLLLLTAALEVVHAIFVIRITPASKTETMRFNFIIYRPVCNM